MPNIEKLDGQSNYASWKFAIKMNLMLEGLWKLVGDSTRGNSDKDNRALAKICLSVKPTCYVHVCNAKSAKEAWDNLQRAFETKGMNRKFELQRHLFGVKISNFTSMEEYINNILTTVHKLAEIGINIEDDFISFVS